MKQIKMSEHLTLYYRDFYPKLFQIKTTKKYKVYLGIGGNVGDTFKIFDKLLKRFKNDTKIDVIQTSPLLKNPPFGYLEQNDFINGVLVAQTNVPPAYLLQILQKYEKFFGRVRTFKDAPRTLDIDIIMIEKFGKNIKLNRKDLIIPHIGMRNRESVQIPLSLLN